MRATADHVIAQLTASVDVLQRRHRDVAEPDADRVVRAIAVDVLS
jgi:hypothetical protein